MTHISLRLWALIMLLASFAASAQAQDAAETSDSRQPSRGRWQQSYESAYGAGRSRASARNGDPSAEEDPRDDGRWSASEVASRPEQGAYPARPDGCESRGAWHASQGQSDYDAPRHNRIDSDYGAPAETSRPQGKPFTKVRRVWTQVDGKRIKTVYDENGNVVYRKAWDKRTGEEVPVASMSSAHGRKGKDYLAVDREASRRAEIEERSAIRRTRPEEGPREHFVRRDVIVRDGPTDWSLAMPVWYNTLTGNLSGVAGGGAGAIASHNNTKPGIELAIPHWAIGYMPLRHNTTVAGAFNFRGVAFAGANLKFDADMYDAYMRWSLFRVHVLDVDWMLGTKVFNPNIVVQAGGVNASFSEVVPVPYLGLIGQWEIDRNMLIKGAIKYSSLSIGSGSENFTEGDIALAYDWDSDFEFSRRNQVAIGFRMMSLDATVSSKATNRAEADVDLRGPYAKLTAYF